MDRFDAMQAFVRVVETGSFTKAAQTLHMSKTTVTQLVQQLEARLRVKLLNRTTRQVHITADGAAYYERAVRLLVDLDDAGDQLVQRRSVSQRAAACGYPPVPWHACSWFQLSRNSTPVIRSFRSKWASAIAWST